MGAETDNDTVYTQSFVWPEPSAVALLEQDFPKCLDKAKLVGFQFENLKFKGISFSQSKVESCHVINVQLSKCYFVESDLDFNMQNASFDRCSFVSSKLAARTQDITFFGCDFSRAKLTCSLQKAEFTNCKFGESEWTACKIEGASFKESDFKGARIEACSFDSCVFKNCDFTAAHFQSLTVGICAARFERCNFENADLRALKSMVMDDCYIAGARLPKDLADPWSTLRRRYTGIRAILNLMLLVVFFLPYAVEAILWVSVNRFESLPHVEEYMCAQGCSKMSVVALLFGYHNGWISVLTACLLVTYNIMRGYLTIQVAPLRENEERCNYTPALEEYGPLYSMHRFVSAVMWFAVTSFFVHLVMWLSSVVSVPQWFLE